MSAWTGAALLAEAGISGVVLGNLAAPRGADEYVEIESIYKCANVLREIILEFRARFLNAITVLLAAQNSN